MPEQQVYIIIVTYNAGKWLDYCLSPFVDNMPQGWRVLIVDNASSDNTTALIRHRFPWVNLIESKINLGFGRANNIALRKALADKVDYVFLLNQDARVSIDSIKELIAVQSRHPDSYITSPIHLAGNEKELDLPFSNYCMPVRCPGLLLGALRGKLSEIYFTNKGNAAAWLLSKDCLERVGGFHPYFYHYGEDDDYVNRVLHAGGKIGVVPGVFATHDRIQKTSTRPLDYKFLRKLIKYTDPARTSPGKLAILCLFLPMLLRNVLRCRYEVVAHYTRTMVDMLKPESKKDIKKQALAAYLC